MANFAEGGVLTIQQAAAKLDVSVDQMLAWNMVVIHEVDGCEVVPGWSADPIIARYMPTLSQVFQGEALTYCLSKIRPLGDGRDGLEALRGGHWRQVLDKLQALRDRFDQAMLESGPPEMAGFAALRAAPAAVTLH